MLVDTHAHLNFNAFTNDYKKIVNKCLDNDIWVINVGTKYETSKRAVELAEKYPKGVFAAVGLHPVHLETGLVKIKNDDEEITLKTAEQDFDVEKYKSLAKSNKVVAIGEVGLDYYWKPKSKEKTQLFKEKQKSVFLKQLILARDLNLPLILHCRMAHTDLINVLQDYHDSRVLLKGVVHCFTGTWDEAQKFLEMGLYLGFNGIIFKNIPGINFKDILINVPLNRILLETDCPYLTPPQVQGRNEPLNLKYVVQEIAKIKKLSYEEIVKVTTRNARNLFGI